MIPPLGQKAKKNWRASWWKWRGEWKVGLKLNIQKTKIMASGPITSWQIDGETVETVAEFIFLISKITADGDYSHEIKTLTPWKKSYDQAKQNIKNQRQKNKEIKSRDITLPTKVHLVKVMFFPVVMYGCESGTIKKSGGEELMHLNCGVGEDSWESLGLQGYPTSPSYRKSVLNIHWKNWCWSWHSNILATWCEELTHLKRPWCWERLKVGGKGDNRGWDGWMASQTQWTWVRVNSGSWWWKGRPGVLAMHGVTKSQTRLNWTE